MARDSNRHPGDFSAATAVVRHLRAKLAAVVLGQDSAIDGVLGVFLAGGHALLVGVPGVAKTLLCKTFASLLGLDFSRIQFTPDLLPADITGSEVFDPARMEWKVSRGPIFAHFLLADEINRAPAKVQSALLEAMQEQQVTLGGKSLPLPSPFMVFATQNPVEMEGVFPLPEAQQDRFLARIDMEYPPAEAEAAFALATAHGHNPIQANASGAKPPGTESGLSVGEWQNLRQTREEIGIDGRLAAYAVDLVRSTRVGDLAHPLRLGAGPRASQALLLLGQAKALLRGGHHVIPEDIQAVAPSVFRHRLVPDETLGWNEERIVEHIRTILDTVPVP